MSSSAHKSVMSLLSTLAPQSKALKLFKGMTPLIKSLVSSKKTHQKSYRPYLNYPISSAKLHPFKGLYQSQKIFSPKKYPYIPKRSLLNRFL